MQVKDAELRDGRGAVHKASDQVQPSWRASDVDVKSLRRTVLERASSGIRAKPVRSALVAAALGLGIGAISAWAAGRFDKRRVQ